MMSHRRSVMIQEKVRHAPHGLLALLGLLILLAGCIGGFIYGIQDRSPLVIVGSVLAAFCTIISLAGFFIVNPNEARVLQFFGSYIGTVKDPGLRWACPFYSKRSVSLRVNNFESQKLKVNDHSGNPIEIAAVVVWKVADTAEACFHVENYTTFVHVQSEAGLRNLAAR